MLRTRHAVGFFVKLILLYALFIVPWPGVREAYGGLYRGAGNLLFRTFGSSGRVYFSAVDPSSTDKDQHDTLLVLENIKSGGRSAPLERNARKDGYLPTAFVVALILATPVPWRRRWIAACWGVAAMSAFAALEMALLLVKNFAGDGPGAVFAFHPWVRKGLVALFLVVSMSPVTAYVAPVFVWVLATFRRGDWTALGASPARPATRSGRRP